MLWMNVITLIIDFSLSCFWWFQFLYCAWMVVTYLQSRLPYVDLYVLINYITFATCMILLWRTYLYMVLFHIYANTWCSDVGLSNCMLKLCFRMHYLCMYIGWPHILVLIASKLYMRSCSPSEYMLERLSVSDVCVGVSACFQVVIWSRCHEV